MLDITQMPLSDAARRYLLDAMGCTVERDEAQLAAEAGDVVGYYAAATDKGNAPGRLAAGRRALAAIGGKLGTVDRQTAERLLSCQHPETGETLGRKLMEGRSRDELLREAFANVGEVSEAEAREITRRVDKDARREGVAFHDFTYSAPKSVSVMHAACLEAGYTQWAEALEQAHREAVAFAQEYAQSTMTVRSYANGSNRPTFESAADGVVRIDFDHETSRGQDPHLHTHSAVIGRAQARSGKWLSLYSQGFHGDKPSWDAAYEAKLSELIEARTAFATQVREDGVTFEIVGVPQQVLDESSTRSAQVIAEVTRAVQKFVAEHGREPTPSEMREIHDKAGKMTRAAKTDATPDEQRKAWAERLSTSVDEVVQTALDESRAHRFWRGQAVIAEPDLIREAVHAVQLESATFSRGDLIEKLQLLMHQHGRPGAWEQCVALADEALTDPAYGVVDCSPRDVALAPHRLRDRDLDRPLWRDPSTVRYTSDDHLAEEDRLCAVARQETAQPLPDEVLASLDAEWDGWERTPTPEQRAAAKALLTSRKAGSVVVAAAGTGKTHMLSMVSAAHRLAGREVYGVATSQVASLELRKAGAERVANATRFVQQVRREGLPAGAVVLFDEVGMTPTADMRAVQDLVRDAGGQMVFVGDPAQLDAVGAGGGLDLLADRNGVDATLGEVHRFAADWERAASLRLRDGDVDVVEVYAQHGRIHAGTELEMATAMVDRYVGDTLAGRESIMIAPTQEQARTLAAAAQAQLAELGVVEAEVVAETIGGQAVAVGDRLQWRKNSSDLESETGEEVVNRENVRVAGVTDDGHIVLERLDDGTAVRVTAEQIAERAELGYAVTAHASQGITVDTAHTTSPDYVSMTRGRESNSMYLATVTPADPEGGTDEVRRSVVDVVAQEMHAAQRRETLSATRQLDLAVAESGEMPALTTQLEHSARAAAADGLRAAAVEYLGPDTGGRLTIARDSDRLIDAYMSAELAGHDGQAVFYQALTSRPMDDVRYPASTLAHRMRVVADNPSRYGLPAPRPAATWSERTDRLAARCDAEVGAFLSTAAERVDQRHDELAEQVTDEWAAEHVGRKPGEAYEGEWRRRAGRVAAYMEDRRIDPAALSVGACPHREDVITRELWRDAARAAGRPVDELEYQNLPTSDLQAMQARWRSVEANAPASVERQLAQARDDERYGQSKAATLRATAEAQPERAEDLLARAERADAEVVNARQRIEQLERVHEARQAYLAEHDAARDAANAATTELERRAAPPAGEAVPVPEDHPSREPEITPELVRGWMQVAEETRDRQEQWRQAEAEQQAQLAEQMDEQQFELFGIAQEEEQAEAAEHVQQAERDAAPAEVETDHSVEVDDQQAELFGDLERDEQHQWRQTERLGEVAESTLASREVLVVPDALDRAEDATRTMADLDVQVRYAEEMVQRRREERERAEAERQAEADAERARQATLDEAAQQAEIALGEPQQEVREDRSAQPSLEL